MLRWRSMSGIVAPRFRTGPPRTYADGDELFADRARGLQRPRKRPRLLAGRSSMAGHLVAIAMLVLDPDALAGGRARASRLHPRAHLQPAAAAAAAAPQGQRPGREDRAGQAGDPGARAREAELTAEIEVPMEEPLKPEAREPETEQAGSETGSDFGVTEGMEGGQEGGVVGGVPGGVLGGVVGGTGDGPVDRLRPAAARHQDHAAAVSRRKPSSRRSRGRSSSRSSSTRNGRVVRRAGREVHPAPRRRRHRRPSSSGSSQPAIKDGRPVATVAIGPGHLPDFLRPGREPGTALPVSNGVRRRDDAVLTPS